MHQWSVQTFLAEDVKLIRNYSIIFVGKYPSMYNPPLREQGKKDWHPQPEIVDSIKGVKFDYFYTGKRLGGQQIELHITSVVMDWKSISYTRKAWYMGSKKDWKKCIQHHIINHLNDLSTGRMLVMSLIKDFEVTDDKFKTWEKYKPVYFKGS